MSTFSAKGRDLTGWKQILELAESLFAKTENRRLRGSIMYERQMPSTSRLDGGTIDIKAGTAVVWSARDDDMDHHWEVRRIERIAPAWRALLPSDIDFEGWSDAICSIELTRGCVTGYAMRENGEDTDSTLAIIHTLENGTWTPRIEISWACDDPDSDVLAMTGDEVAEEVRRNNWFLHGAGPVGYKSQNGNLVVIVPNSALATIDREDMACAA